VGVKIANSRNGLIANSRLTNPAFGRSVSLYQHCVVLVVEHDDQFEVLVEWLALELVPLGIDHLSYLNFLLQDTKQTISIIQDLAGNWAVSK
jgi:hypothetical protein